MRAAGSQTPPSSSESPDLRLSLLLVGLTIAAIAVLLIASFTSTLIGTSVIRVVVALLLAGVTAWLGIGYFRQLAHPPPPDPLPEQVPDEIGLTYVCKVCGLELAVVKVARDKAPKHCGEDMSLRVEGG